jgi:CheY-like chemotaxis protein
MLDIVLVDDDHVSTFVTEQYIRKSLLHPHRIHKFSSAVDALHKIAEINPDYLFLDLIMPQMTGWDFLDQIKDVKLISEVYILSGSLDKSDVERADNNKIVKKFLPKLTVKECIPEIFRK